MIEFNEEGKIAERPLTADEMFEFNISESWDFRYRNTPSNTTHAWVSLIETPGKAPRWISDERRIEEKKNEEVNLDNLRKNACC